MFDLFLKNAQVYDGAFRPANLLILDAENDYDAVRRQAKVLTSIRHGEVIMQRQPEQICYPE